jgi:hypothetical protein
VRRRAWSDAELEWLRRAYDSPVVDLIRLAKKLDRSHASVALKASKMGLTSYKGPKVAQTRLDFRQAFAPELRHEVMSRKIKARFAKFGHPRGMLGKKHSAETKARVGAASRAQWADPASKLRSPAETQRRSDQMVRLIKAGLRVGYSRCRGGRRPDLNGRYFRSSWEANYARLLNFQMKHGAIIGWDFECHTFEFVGIKRGSRLYIPDFKVTFADGHHEWHEVKGWLDQRSATKLKRMAKYFPDEKVVVIDAKSFAAFRRQGFDQMIPHWERTR